MRPSGATNRRGYHSSARFAVESSRQCVPSHTSGIVSIVMFSSVPPTVSISPSGSVVLVGYHRPTAIGGPTCQEWVTGSNRLVLGRPCPSVMCPPATSSRPSGRKSWPAQHNHDGLGTAVKLPVAGSHTCGSPMRPQLSTVPSVSR